MLLWLEDQDLADDLVPPLVKGPDGPKLVKVARLSDVHGYLSKNDGDYSGIIIDLALTDSPTLEEVGLPDVHTNDGLDAGFFFLAHCIRNYQDNPEAPYGDRYRGLPALILTGSRKSTIKLRYRDWMKFEEDRRRDTPGWGMTEWRSKPDYDGLPAFQQFFRIWLQGLKA